MKMRYGAGYVALKQSLMRRGAHGALIHNGLGFSPNDAAEAATHLSLSLKGSRKQQAFIFRFGWNAICLL
jgi:hypothetical protein